MWSLCLKVVPVTYHTGESRMLAQLSRERRTGKGGEPKQGSHGHTGESTTGLAQGERQEHRHRGRTLSDEEVEGEGAVIPKLHWIKKTTLQSFI